jgi:hypothetical protein
MGANMKYRGKGKGKPKPPSAADILADLRRRALAATTTEENISILKMILKVEAAARAPRPKGTQPTSQKGIRDVRAKEVLQERKDARVPFAYSRPQAAVIEAPTSATSAAHAGDTSRPIQPAAALERLVEQVPEPQPQPPTPQPIAPALLAQGVVGTSDDPWIIETLAKYAERDRLKAEQIEAEKAEAKRLCAGILAAATPTDPAPVPVRAYVAPPLLPRADYDVPDARVCRTDQPEHKDGYWEEKVEITNEARHNLTLENF